jgi:lipoprotein NlpI
MQLLKSCYKEHDIEKYFYLSRDDVEQNQFLSKVIDEAVSFFTTTLSKRVYQYVNTSQPLIVTGDIIQNASFLPLFQDSYRNYGT